MAGDLLAALERSRVEPSIPLRVARTSVKLTYPAVGDLHFEHLTEAGGLAPAALGELIDRRFPWQSPVDGAGALDVELVAGRVGTILLVAVPYEVFAETGRRLREKSGLSVATVALANSVIGYLPPADELPRGGYEVDESFLFFGSPGLRSRRRKPALSTHSRGSLLNLRVARDDSQLIAAVHDHANSLRVFVKRQRSRRAAPDGPSHHVGVRRRDGASHHHPSVFGILLEDVRRGHGAVPRADADREVGFDPHRPASQATGNSCTVKSSCWPSENSIWSIGVASRSVGKRRISASRPIRSSSRARC